MSLIHMTDMNPSLQISIGKQTFNLPFLVQRIDTCVEEHRYPTDPVCNTPLSDDELMRVQTLCRETRHQQPKIFCYPSLSSDVSDGVYKSLLSHLIQTQAQATFHVPLPREK